jgi:hypothetical protein
MRCFLVFESVLSDVGPGRRLLGVVAEPVAERVKVITFGMVLIVLSDWPPVKKRVQSALFHHNR